MNSNKPLVEMAKLLRRSNLPVVRKGMSIDLPAADPVVQPSAQENSRQVLQKPVIDPVLSKPLDSWDIRNRPQEMNPLSPQPRVEPKPVAPPTVHAAEPEVPKPSRRGRRKQTEVEPEPRVNQPEKVPELNYFDSPSAPGYIEHSSITKRMSPTKVRNTSLMVCVSHEEARLIRDHVEKNGMSFSSWARHAIFKAMGRSAPARPRKK